MNTKRTDAEEERTATPSGLTGVVSADFARELERELHAMTQERDAAIAMAASLIFDKMRGTTLAAKEKETRHE